MIQKLKIIYYNVIFTYKIHIKWLPTMNMILENLILPVLSGIFYVAVADYISDRDIIFYVSGSICFTAVGASVGGISMLISSERRFGTLYATIGSVFHPIYLFLGRILYWCAVGYFRFMAVFFSLFLIFIPERLTFQVWLQNSLLYFLICIALSGIGYFVGIIGLRKRSVMGISSLVESLLLLFSEIYFSKELFPQYIRGLCNFSPLYYGVNICRNMLVYGRYDTVFRDILAMIAVGCAYMAAGTVYFHFIHKKILTEGKIDLF